MAAAYVSHTTGAASRSVTVASGTDRLLVVTALSTADTAARSATYGGVSMSVAQTDNGWAQIFYMLSPTVGSATLAVTGTGISTVVAAHYTGITSFQSGQEATGVASASFSPNGAALIVFGMVASSTSHTPVASTTERYDTGGDYFAERIVTGSGSVTVGVSSATDPDYAGAIFLEPLAAVSVSGTPAAPRPTVAGTATITVTASGTPSAPKPTVSGSASVIVAASGSVAAPKPTVAAAASILVSASGTPSAPAATLSGSATVGEVTPEAAGAPVAPAPSVTGAASVLVTASGTPSAPAPTASGSASPVLASVGASGASVSAPRPTVAGTASVVLVVAEAPGDSFSSSAVVDGDSAATLVEGGSAATVVDGVADGLVRRRGRSSVET